MKLIFSKKFAIISLLAIFSLFCNIHSYANTSAKQQTTVSNKVNFVGASKTTISRIEKVLETAKNTTTGSGVTNYTQDSNRGRDADFAWLITGGTLITNQPNISIYQLQDGTKIIKRPSTTGPKTIEIQRKDGRKVMEIRYAKD